MRTFTVVLSPDPERGGFSVSCPAMPGALSQGDTREETLRNIQEAMELWDETMAEKGRGPLEETPELIAAEVAFVFDWRAEEGWSFELETATVVLAA